MEDIDKHHNRIKNNIGADVMGIVSEFMDNHNEEDSLDDRYVGEVINNADPEKLGRCRIRIFGVFGDDVPDNKLPWAVPDFGFVGSNKGSFIVPTEGTLVNIYFDRGEIYLPHYTTKVLNTKQLPTKKDDNYPDNMIFFETDDGDSFEINRSTSIATFEHSSGTTLKILKDGSVDISSVANITTNHSDTLTVNGNSVTPTGIGPLCAKRICPFDGTPHTGTTCSSIGTVSVDGDLF